MALRKTIIEIKVLWNTEDHPNLSSQSLSTILEEGERGCASISIETKSDTEIDRDTAAKLLSLQGSDPEFLLRAE